MTAQKTIVFNNGEIQVEHVTQGSDVLIVTFNAFGDLGFDIVGFGEVFLSKLGYDLLFIKTLSNSWYQNLTSDDMAKIGQEICSNYKEVIGYSISMGAYALLYFSQELLISRAIAYCPQYSIDRKVSPFETRWQHEASIIQFQHDWGDRVFSTHVTFIYDPYAFHDQAHIEQYLPHFPNHTLVKLNFLGHPTLGGLLESGQLSTLISGLLHQEPIDWQKVKKTIRAKSIHVYMVEMLIYCTHINLRRSIQLYYYFRQLHQSRFDEFEIAMTGVIFRLIDDKKYLPAYIFILCHSYFNSYKELLGINSISYEQNKYIEELLPKRLRILAESITHGFRTYSAIEHEIKTEHAYRYKQRIYSNKKAGVFTFGPYVYLPASIFKVCIEAEVNYFPENQQLILKVTTDGGKNLIKQVAISNLRKGIAFWEIEEVCLEQEANNVEVVIIVPEHTEIMLDKISIILQKMLLNYNQKIA